VERFKITVALDPGNVDYRRSLAEALDKLERYSEARAVLAVAATMTPDDPGLIYQQAMNFQHLGRSDDAIAAYKRVVELSPDSMDAIIAQRFIELLEMPLHRALSGPIHASGTMPAMSSIASWPPKAVRPQTAAALPLGGS
jgi:tetratricopeptide (TPR) repeat protein